MEESKNLQGTVEYCDENEEPEFDDIDSDDSEEEDPNYDFLEETRSALSKLSVKKSKTRIVKRLDLESDGEGEEAKAPEFGEKDEICFAKVEKIIQAGDLEKLKVDQCKVYLRKYRLRLTGKKEVLIERIREHHGIFNGGGEEKYPVSSFILNCKGDACTGDVVMFEQNVYDMYSIVSRSATAAPCGTRTVVGRIVKESYGAAKQQHTFTIEVLWCKGTKPLPPLHPLLIKGRNLYRLKTMRQRWADEEERRKALLEKHARGNCARSTREVRILGKEMRKKVTIRRLQREESSKIQEQSYNQPTNPVKFNKIQQPSILGSHPNILAGSSHDKQPSQRPIMTSIFEQPNMQQHFNYPTISRGPEQHNHRFPSSIPMEFLTAQPYRNSSVSHHRPPLTNLNYCSSRAPPQTCPGERRMRCRFYQQGTCRYGDACKWLHE